jgi:hypothetical protein
MAAKFGVKANEEGTCVIEFTFRDENDTLVVPVSATWSLVDTRGSIVNSRSAVSLSSLASGMSVVLSGNDLVVNTVHGKERIFILEYTYDSSNGTNLPNKEYCQFAIQDITGIT